MAEWAGAILSRGREGTMGSRFESLAAVVALAVGAALLAASCAFAIEDLGGPSSWAVAINDAGVIVGISEVPGSTPEHRIERAFRRSPDGVTVELASLPGSTGTSAIAVNDAGQVAGSAQMPGATPQDDTIRAVRWDADGTIHDLGLVGNLDATVRAIDEQGRIIGWNDPPGGDSKAFVFDPAVGHLVDLPALPDGQDSVALGMNDEGDVVGYQWVGPVPLAAPVRWDLDAGTVTDLSSNWGAGLVSDINDDGTMIGLARFPSPTPPGTVTEAAILRPGEAGPTALGAGSWALPFAINDDEVVVGWHTASPEPSRAFRWERSTGAVKLTDQESYATGLNDLGQMVGQSNHRAAIFVVPRP